MKKEARYFLYIETDMKLRHIEPVKVTGFFRPVYTYEITDPSEYYLALRQLGKRPVKCVAGGRI